MGGVISGITSMFTGGASSAASLISGGRGQAEGMLANLGNAQNMTLEMTMRSQIMTMIHDMLMSIAKNFH